MNNSPCRRIHAPRGRGQAFPLAWYSSAAFRCWRGAVESLHDGCSQHHGSVGSRDYGGPSLAFSWMVVVGEAVISDGR